MTVLSAIVRVHTADMLLRKSFCSTSNIVKVISKPGRVKIPNTFGCIVNAPKAAAAAEKANAAVTARRTCTLGFALLLNL